MPTTFFAGGGVGNVSLTVHDKGEGKKNGTKSVTDFMDDPLRAYSIHVQFNSNSQCIIA